MQVKYGAPNGSRSASENTAEQDRCRQLVIEDSMFLV
jgi:hypothetical protein